MLLLLLLLLLLMLLLLVLVLVLRPLSCCCGALPLYSTAYYCQHARCPAAAAATPTPPN